MKGHLRENRGFCYGVRRAVDMAEAQGGKRSFLRYAWPIIHNAHMIEHLAGKGIGCVENFEQMPVGAAAIIRSHGEGKPVYRQLEQRGIPVIDATCPTWRRSINWCRMRRRADAARDHWHENASGGPCNCCLV